jgi:hypothetical protein
MTSGFSRLLDLPTELRELIYVEALVNYKPLTVAAWHNPASFDSNPKLYENWAYQPALFRTSRQLRREALPVFYTENCFRWCLDLRITLDIATAWLTRLPPGTLQCVRFLQLGEAVAYGGHVVVDLWLYEISFIQAQKSGGDDEDGIRNGGGKANGERRDARVVRKWQWPYMPDVQAIRMRDGNVAVMRELLVCRKVLHERQPVTAREHRRRNRWSSSEMELLFTVAAVMLRPKGRGDWRAAVLNAVRMEDATKALLELMAWRRYRSLHAGCTRNRGNIIFRRKFETIDRHISSFPHYSSQWQSLIFGRPFLLQPACRTAAMRGYRVITASVVHPWYSLA